VENTEITAEFSRLALKTRKKESPPKTSRVEPPKEFPNSLGIKELPLYLVADWAKINACFMVGVYKILGTTEAGQWVQGVTFVRGSIADCAVGFSPFPTFSRGNLDYV